MGQTALRDDLLSDRTVAVAGPMRAPLSAVLERLGAQLERFDAGLDEQQAQAWAHERRPLHGLVYDGAEAFGAGGREGLLAATDHCWQATRAVATGSLIPAGAGGRIILIAAVADARPHSDASRAALENLARTLSTEWARYSITVTTIAPAGRTTDAEIGTLVGFLLSTAGDYFSGCQFELGRISEGDSG